MVGADNGAHRISAMRAIQLSFALGAAEPRSAEPIVGVELFEGSIRIVMKKTTQKISAAILPMRSMNSGEVTHASIR
jgi:hypothetical protein